MRQRNDSGYPLDSFELGRTIGDGEEFKAPGLVAGCTSLEPQDPGPEREPAREPATKDASETGGQPSQPRAGKRQAANAATKE